MTIKTWLCLCLLSVTLFSRQKAWAFSPLKDDIYFNINWHKAGTKLSDLEVTPGHRLDAANSYTMMTADKERYVCTLPTEDSGDEDEEGQKREVEASLAPHLLLAPLFGDDNCAYRVESYWTYEVCHAKHVRQYHEERVRGASTEAAKKMVVSTDKSGGKVTIKPSSEGTLVKTVEYFLGYLDGSVSVKGVLEDAPPAPQSADEVPRRKINGKTRPYFAINMTDGTACDLKPGSMRKTTVLYVCSASSYNEVSAVVEVSTCEYEIIVMTPHLCANPLYRIESKEVAKIQCIAEEGSPPNPSAMMAREKDLSVTDHQALVQKVLKEAIMLGDTSETMVNEDGTATVKIRVLSHKLDSKQLEALNLNKPAQESKQLPYDDQLLSNFLSGKDCLHGGSGWWRFELCYGKHVHQYHDDPKTGRTTIVLGTWDEAAHLEWVKSGGRPLVHTAIPVKPNSQPKLIGVQQFYTDGDFCEEAKAKRKVTVRLQCRAKIPSSTRQKESNNAVIIYMSEPKTCVYQLTVESSMICDLLDKADDNGLFHLDP